MKHLPERALIIRSPHIEKVLAGTKTWEIRSRPTNIRGPIGLIRSGSGLVVATGEVVDCRGPLSFQEFKRNALRAGWKPAEITQRPYPTTYAWVLNNVKVLPTPLAYRHPRGTITWVKLTAAVMRPQGARSDTPLATRTPSRSRAK